MLQLDRRSLFATAAATVAGRATTSALAAEPRAKADAVPHGTGIKSPHTRNVRGKILYIGDDGKERGREWFGFTFREDGQITLRAYCEIDDGRVERDVVYTMNAKYHPLDCFVRLTVGGKFLGTGWVRVTDTLAECEVFNTTMGRISQRVPLEMPAPSLGAHPLANDVLHLAQFDHSKPERVQTIPGSLSTSPLPDGASGPFLAVSNGFPIEYLGPEKVKTAVGTIDAHHYRFLLSPRDDGAKRWEDVWCTQPDYIFVRAEVHGYLKSSSGFGRYELVELES